MLRKYLLSTAARFAPPDDTGAGAGDDDELLDDLPPDELNDGDGTEPDEPDDTTGDDDEAPGDDVDGERQAARAPGEREERPAPRGRAASRIDRLQERLDAAERRAEAAERRAQEREQPPQPQQRQMTPQEENAYLATMTVDERMEYRNSKLLREIDTRNNAVMTNVRDQTDRSAFAAQLTEKPHLKRYEAEVEQRYNRLIKEGGYVPRTGILIYMLGERAFKAQQAGNKQVRDATRRVNQQRTRPPNGRDDVQAQRRGARSLEDRLADVPI